jgi:competence protein ComEA
MRQLNYICLLVSTGWLLAMWPVAAAEQLETFHGCRFVDEDWADGDSFPVRFPDGTLRTVRLYGADCLESSVEGSESNAQRLRDQRRWFGITDITAAHTMGHEGKKETKRLLAKPFTVHTAFSDARGDTRFGRIYAFVTTSSGEDMSELLISRGLARAFGVVRQCPDGTKGDEWREQLRDLEALAMKKGLGAWKLTDWDQLPTERRAAREEEAEIVSVRGSGSKTAPDQPIDINQASRDEILTLPGVGEVMALRIIEARPYTKTDDLLQVSGIGPKTLEKMAPFIKIAPQAKSR